MTPPDGGFCIAAVQMDVQLGDTAANLRKICQKLGQAAEQAVRLVVFPECALTGYGFGSRAEAATCAEPIPGPGTEAIAQSCREHQVFAVVGMLEQSGDRLYNAAVLIGAEGVVGVYRKVHLPFMGVDRYVDPGEQAFEILKVDGVRLGLHICYDGSFPEVGRTLSLLGADLLVLPTNWPSAAVASAEHLMACRSLENTVFSIAVDRVGTERGTEFIGRSSIHDPYGERMAFGSADREEILIAEIHPSRARQKQIVRKPGEQEVNRIADRRPQFYGELIRRNDG